MTILIVDDEEYLRTDLADSLERVSPGNKLLFASDYYSAMEIINKEHIDIAFLDIQMPGKNGLTLAESIKRNDNRTNIVMVTAYSNYAVNAFRLFVSGYLLKPVMDNDLRDVLDNLRYPVIQEKKKLEIMCFGNFEVFVDGKPMKKKKKKEKELLAYLVCLKGASAKRSEITSVIFDESTDTEKNLSYFKKLASGLKKDLDRYGLGDILIHLNNSYSIDTSRFNCDYYDHLAGKASPTRTYKGEFINQYSWAETYIYSLENY